MTELGTLDLATSVAEGAARLADSAARGTDLGQLVETVAAIAQARTLLDSALLDVAAALEAGDVLDDLGWASVKDFLTSALGGHKGAGGGVVRAADQVHDLPAVRAALRDGAVSLAQARVIAGRVATLPKVPEFRAEVADRMLDLVAAHGHDASDLQAAFGSVVREADPTGAIINTEKSLESAERGAHHCRELTFVADGRGGIKLTGYGTVEDGERIKTVLMSLAAPRTTAPGACGGDPGPAEYDHEGCRATASCPDPGCAHDGRDPRPHRARMFDALVDACESLRATDQLPREHGAVPRVIVTIDHASLRQDVIDADRATEATTPLGATLSASAVRRLACDAEVLPAVLGAESQVLDLGRTRRLVTAALFMALVVRDHHCRFPGCSRPPAMCDAHHITHWADGGPTSLDNLILLCRRHHTVVHTTPWQVRLDPRTRQPVWEPPPRRPLTRYSDRISYHPARPAA